MNLIGRNLLAAYINEHPEAQIPLLLWLNEHLYSKHEATFLRQDAAVVVGKGCASLEMDRYIVRYKINYPARAVCITWVGDEHSFEEILEAEEREAEQQATILGQELKTVEISITAPRPVAKKNKQQTLEVKRAWNPVDEQVIKDYNDLQAFHEDLTICSESEYKVAIRKTTENFEAAPGSPAFEELIRLLPVVSIYEFRKLDLPALRSFEIVAYRMKVFDMEESYFASIVGGKAKLDNFLAGKQRLPDRFLSRIYRSLGITLPISEEYRF